MTRSRAFLADHWLISANCLVGVFVALPVLAPILMAFGLTNIGEAIYSGYSLVCHQWAHRSFFLVGQEATYSLTELVAFTGASDAYGLLGTPALGYKVAFCERDLAIYTTIVMAGLGFASGRGRIRPLPLLGFSALILPIAVDGFTQLFGWRESTPALRVATGSAFGLACVWFIYPRIDMLVSSRRSTQTGALLGGV